MWAVVLLRPDGRTTRVTTNDSRVVDHLYRTSNVLRVERV